MITQHRFYDGEVYHKRYLPKENEFKYKFFMLDINTDYLSSLKNRFFSLNSFNLFSFKTKDHFGKSSNFDENIDEILKKFKIEKTSNMRFITLPNIFNFVFNPISLLLIVGEDEVKYLLAEVHNYNGGRTVYPIKLSKHKNFYKGEIKKDMYVSPFFKRDGDYAFVFRYSKDEIFVKIDLFEDNKKKLTAYFKGKGREFSSKNILKLFLKHQFLTLFVVTRTLYQSLKLYLKGLKFTSPIKEDTKRRF